MPFGEHALGLFDQDPVVQRPLQLLGEDVLLLHRALLEQADRGDVRQPLAQGDALLGELAGPSKKMFIAPTVSERSRNGNACTEVNFEILTAAPQPWPPALS